MAEDKELELWRLLDHRQHINSIVATTEKRHPDWDYHFFGQAGEVFLWYKRGLNPITGLRVSNEAVPNFEKLDRNLGSNAAPVYLWYRYGGAPATPVADLACGTQIPPEYIKVDEGQPLRNAQGQPLVLGYGTIKTGTQLNRYYRQGDEWDVAMNIGQRYVWKIAEIINIDSPRQMLRVQASGAPRGAHEAYIYQEWVPFIVNNRVRPLWSETGFNMGFDNPTPYFFSTLKPTFAMANKGVDDLLAYLQTGLPLTEPHKYFITQGAGHRTLRRLLHCQLDDNKQAVHAIAFINKMVTVAMRVMFEDFRFNFHMLEMVRAVFLSDPVNAGYFYGKYGVGKTVDSPKHTPKTVQNTSCFLLMAVNHFVDIGGIDLLRQRLDFLCRPFVADEVWTDAERIAARGGMAGAPNGSSPIAAVSAAAGQGGVPQAVPVASAAPAPAAAGKGGAAGVPLISSYHLLMLLDILGRVKRYLLPATQAELSKVFNLQNVVPNFFRNVTDGELRDETLKDRMKPLLRSVIENMSDPTLPVDDVELLVENSELTMLHRMLSSGQMVPVLQAVTDIESAIVSISPPQLMRQDSQNARPAVLEHGKVWDPYLNKVVDGEYDHVTRQYVLRKADRRVMSPADLLAWLQQHHVLEQLLTQAIHEQVIKKCALIFKFFAQQGVLTLDHLRLLWKAKVGKDQSTVNIVYGIVIDLPMYLDREHIDYLFELIASDQDLTPLKYQEYDLDFLERVTSRVIRSLHHQAPNAPPHSWFGLETFWRLVENPAVSPEIRAAAATRVLRLLTKPLFDTQRRVYIDACIASVSRSLQLADKEKERENQAKEAPNMLVLELLRGLLDLSASRPDQLAELIRELNGKNGLVGLVLSSPGRIYSAHLAATANQSAFHSQQTMAKASSDVIALLGTLKFLLEKSGSTLTAPEMQLLWRSLSCYPATTELLLDWLLRVSGFLQEPALPALPPVHIAGYPNYAIPAAKPLAPPPPPTPIFSGEALRALFASLSSSWQPATLTQTWYKCFEMLLLNLNWESGVIRFSPKTPRRLDIDLFHTTNVASLVGLDALWHMATVSHTQSVREAASKLIVLLYTRLDPLMTSADRRKSLNSVVEKCVELMRVAAGSKADEEESRRIISQAVDIMQLLLRRLNNAPKSSPSAPLYYVGEAVKAWWKSNKKNIKYEALVENFNPELGTYHVGYSDGDVDINCPETNLFQKSDDERRIIDAADWTAPQDFLRSSSECFDLFFQLLGLGGPVAQQMWGMLAVLPMNEAMLQRIDAIADADASAVLNWQELLPSDSVIKLLYTLTICKDFIPLPQEVPAAGARAAPPALNPKGLAWRRSFVQHGGFQHLYQSLSSIPSAEMLDGQLPQNCLALILRILQYFLFEPEQSSGVDPAAVAALVKLDVLVGRLLALLREMVIRPLPPQVAPELLKSNILLMKQILGLLMAVVTRSPELLPAIYQFDNWYSILIDGLVTSVNKAVQGVLSLELGKLFSLLDKSEGGPGIEITPPVVADRRAQEAKLAQDDGLTDDAIPAGLTDVVAVPKGAASKLRAFLLPKLLSYLQDIDTTSRTANHAAYFGLVTALMQNYQPGEVLDYSQLGNTLSGLIRAHPFEINDDTPEQQLINGTMAGLLQVTADLVGKYPELQTQLGMTPADSGAPNGNGLFADLMHYLLDIPLSTTTNRSGASAAGCDAYSLPPKLKTERSRQYAFDLLTSLTMQPPAANFIIRFLMPNHLSTHSMINSNQTEEQKWMFKVPQDDFRRGSLVPYVGIQNLSSICYMNSSLQQLFMIPQLRQAMLSVVDHGAGGIKETASELQHSLVFQLQQIFVQLQETTDWYVNPRSLCDVLTDEDNQPIRVNVQEDQALFLLRLFDRVHESLKGTQHSTLLSDLIQGTTIIQKVGRNGCPHVRLGNQECWWYMPIKVGGVGKLEESLDQLVRGELMSGGNAVMCDQCNVKRDTQKREPLAKLPPVLLLQPKRFEMNWEMDPPAIMKINDRLEFPTELNMKKYTLQGLQEAEKAEADRLAAENPDAAPADVSSSGEAYPAEYTNYPEEYFEYVLRGVVIHTGAFNGGHYFSYIQERDGKYNPDGSVTTNGAWFEFNDTRVSPFDHTKLDVLAYGGDQPNTPVLFGGKSSASLLIYERKYRIDANNQVIRGPSNATPAAASAVPAVEVSGGAAGAGAAGNDAPPPPNVAAAVVAAAAGEVTPRAGALMTKMLEEIWQSNRIKAREQTVFDKAYFKFVRTYVQMRTKQLLGDDPLSPSAGANGERKENAADLAAPSASASAAAVSSSSAPIDLRTLDLSRPVNERDALARFALRFFLRTFTKADPELVERKEKSPMTLWWGQVLRRLLQDNVPTSAWLLHLFGKKQNSPSLSKLGLMHEFLLHCTWDNVRFIAGDLVSLAMSQVVPLESELLSLGWQDPKLDNPLPTPAELRTAEDTGDVNLLAATHDALLKIPARGYSGPCMDRILERFAYIDQEKLHWAYDLYRVMAAFACARGPDGSEGSLAYLASPPLNALVKMLDIYYWEKSPEPRMDLRSAKQQQKSDLRSPLEQGASNFIQPWIFTEYLWVTMGLLCEYKLKTLPHPWYANLPADQTMLFHQDTVVKHDKQPEKVSLLLYGAINEATGRRRGVAVWQLLHSLMKENAKVVDYCVDRMTLAAAVCDYDSLRTYYRLIAPMCEMKDSNTAKRAEFVTLKVHEWWKKSLMRFWKDSDHHIDQVIRIAQLSPNFRAVLRARPEIIQEYVAWLTKYPNPPDARSNSLAAPRPAAPPRWGRKALEPNVRDSPFTGAYHWPVAEKIARLEQIRDDRVDLSDAGYDSDDATEVQHFETGETLEIRDPNQQWGVGKVELKLGRLVKVRYIASSVHGGREESAWLMENSKRLAKLNSGYTSQAQIQAFR